MLLLTYKYKKARSCVKSNAGQLSQVFPSLVGVRQGDNLSPLLFAIYLNDLQRCPLNSCKGLSLISNLTYDVLQTEDTVVYLNLITLLYADDTIILAESKEDMQKSLDTLYSYCNEKDLNINVSKTKVCNLFKRQSEKHPLVSYRKLMHRCCR